MALSMTPTILHATGRGVSTATGTSPSCSRARPGSLEATSFILARAALNVPSLGERGLRLSATGPGSFEAPALIMPPRPLLLSHPSCRRGLFAWPLLDAHIKSRE